MVKLSPADKLENAIRAQYIPAQIAELIGQVCAAETNAKWRATDAGKRDAIENEGYEEADLLTVLEKQEKQRQRLLAKVGFLKELYNEQAKK